MKKAYIYPLTSRIEGGDENPYLSNFIHHLSTQGISFVNKENPSGIGIFDVLKYNNIDYLFLNWIENVPDKKYGFFQYLFFIVYIKIFRLIFKKKVIWTLHNKLSHSKTNVRIKRKLFNYIMHNADYIITHAQAGVEFIHESTNINSNKIIFFPHPITPQKKDIENPVKDIDILIWGTQSEYKGLDKFLSLIKGNPQIKKLKITICGRFPDNKYEERVKNLVSENITLITEYLPFDNIIAFMKRAKCVLFTYSGDSVLSSGALADTIAAKCYIIGPLKGAFIDACKKGVAKLFSNEDELMDILNHLNQIDLNTKHLDDYIHECSWENFSDHLVKNFLK